MAESRKLHSLAQQIAAQQFYVLPVVCAICNQPQAPAYYQDFAQMPTSYDSPYCNSCLETFCNGLTLSVRRRFGLLYPFEQKEAQQQQRSPSEHPQPGNDALLNLEAVDGESSDSESVRSPALFDSPATTGRCRWSSTDAGVAAITQRCRAAHEM
jgi:hypothetical protein